MRELSWLLLLLINANIYATILTPEEELLEPLLEHNYDRKHYHVPGPLFMQIWHNSRCGRDRLAPGPLEGPEQECWGYSNVSTKEMRNRTKTMKSRQPAIQPLGPAQVFWSG